jgi:hypothetical protein
MALILAESFERYAASADIAGTAGTNDDNVATANNWTKDPNVVLSAAGGRFSQQVVDAPNNGDDLFIRFNNTRTASNILIVQFAFKPIQGGVGSIISSQPWVSCTTGTTSTYHWRLYLTPSGNVYTSNPASTEANPTACGAHMRMNAWNFIQIKVNLADAGTLTLKINGVTVINALAGDWNNGAASVIAHVILSGLAGNHLYDSIVVMDGSGATFNDFVDDMRVENLVVDADGSIVNWTASAGNDFQCVDDALAAWNTTDYISSATLDQDSLFTHQNIASASGTIHFVQQLDLTRADAAAEKIALVCKSGATTSVGTDIALLNHATTWRWRKRFYEVDPNTSAAWTTANIDAAEFGVRKRV